ncbi:hypothetical protein MMC06_006250 [Schaereria dolodes]|nr:hypothetical protein [Schaereria dolodes]
MSSQDMTVTTPSQQPHLTHQLGAMSNPLSQQLPPYPTYPGTMHTPRHQQGAAMHAHNQTTSMSPTANTFSPIKRPFKEKSMKDHACYFWLHSECKYKEEDCLYAHRYMEKVAEKPVHLQQGQPAVAGNNVKSGNPIYRRWRGSHYQALSPSSSLIVKHNNDIEEFQEQLEVIDALSVRPKKTPKQQDALKDDIIRGEQSMLNTCLVTLEGTTQRLREWSNGARMASPLGGAGVEVEMQKQARGSTPAGTAQQEIEKIIKDQEALLRLLKEAKEEVAILLRRDGLGNLVNTEE